MYLIPYDNLPKSQAERQWWERIIALGYPEEKIPKPFWYMHVKVYIFLTRYPGVPHQPNEWHAQFWASSVPTVTECCESSRKCKKLAKKLIWEEKSKNRLVV